MGKHSKGIKKNQQLRKDGQVKQVIKQYVQQSKGYLEAEEYAKVIENLAAMIEKKMYAAEAMYDGAYSYYMLGDYKRAASWVENVLHYAPDHIQARLLLANICILEARWQDVFALYELLLQYYSGKLTAEEMEEIRNNMADAQKDFWQENKGKHPHLDKFLDSGSMEKGASPTDFAIFEENRNAPQMQDALPLARMKKEEVLQAHTSIMEKLKMLNAFAAGFFMENQYAAAEILLNEALKLDVASRETLRNMVILQSCMGNEEKKQAFLAQMPMSDFQLLMFKP